MQVACSATGWGLIMAEWIERMMHALGWIPTERERALEDALEKVRSSHSEDRAALEAERRELIRTIGSWEMAEARLVELEAERRELVELFGSMSQARRAGLNYKTQAMNRMAAEMIGAGK